MICFDWHLFEVMEIPCASTSHFFLFRKKNVWCNSKSIFFCSVQTANYEALHHRCSHLWVTEEQSCLSLYHHWLSIIQSISTSISSKFIHNIVQYIQQSYLFCLICKTFAAYTEIDHCNASFPSFQGLVLIKILQSTIWF